MSIGSGALAANAAALQTIGHNIANASTVGYSRQQTVLQTASGEFKGQGFFGKGVDIASVTRGHDAFLTREVLATQSMAAADSARLASMQQLERAFGIGESGLGYATGQLLNAFVDVASGPQDYAARQVVLSRAEDVASRFRTAAQDIKGLQSGVVHDVSNLVVQVNALAQGIAGVNKQIVAVRGLGQPPNDLLDQRDQLVSELGKLVQVTVIEADSGAQSVFIGGSQRLVLGGQALQLTTVPGTFDSSQVQISILDSGAQRVLPNNLIVGGSIAGLLRFQNTDLQDARNAIGQLAAALAGAINEQQAFGLDLSIPASSGAPIFSVGAPRVLPANTNARAADGSFTASYVDASGVRVSSVGLTVVDTSDLPASDYALRADPAGLPGAYQLTRLSDGLVRTVNSGDIVDGFRVDIAVPAPATSDQFLLQPLSSAALDMKRILQDPRGIAAASPVTATVAAANQGTVGVGLLRAVSTALDPTLRADISFTSDTGDYTWELRDRSTNALVSTGAQTWTAGTPIALNGWELQLSGVPRNGDAVTVDTTTYAATNNGNALALVALRDAGLVGRQTLTSGTVLSGITISDAYGNAIANVGVKVQSAKTAAAQSSSMATSAELRRNDVSGVNLDEEAARLIQFQQSYQAAAKMLQVAQSIIDTLLQVTNS